ncbi:hypothetical protein [Streptomyces sp. RPT161]|uniref:hypothetical protein n=1 Tax=Streptomyces sp. RPT161 TaxID=3015993 RepID=UPI0022B8B7ED|nr:hypothetical protein [Streptomyces sp. RPT161]
MDQSAQLALIAIRLATPTAHHRHGGGDMCVECGITKGNSFGPAAGVFVLLLVVFQVFVSAFGIMQAVLH